MVLIEVRRILGFILSPYCGLLFLLLHLYWGEGGWGFGFIEMVVYLGSGCWFVVVGWRWSRFSLIVIGGC